MSLLDIVLSNARGPFFTFKDHFGKEHTMRAKAIHNYIMEQSQESDYEWIAPAIELVKICKDERFPRQYAVDIEMAILNCFANIEVRVNRGGDKHVTKANDARAVQYCYDELGKLAQSTDNEELKKSIMSARTRYLKEMISSAVNTTVRGDYIYCEAYSKLKEEVIRKYFVKYSTMKEDFNILDMYEEISDETDEIFKQAYKNGMLKQAEDEASFCLVKMFNNEDIFYPKKYSGVRFKGNHTRNYIQDDVQDFGEDTLSK